MFAVLIVIHVIISCGLMLVVLMQSSKGEGSGGSVWWWWLEWSRLWRSWRGHVSFQSHDGVGDTVYGLLHHADTRGERSCDSRQVGESAVQRMATEQPVPTQAPAQQQPQGGQQQGTQTPPSGGGTRRLQHRKFEPAEHFSAGFFVGGVVRIDPNSCRGLYRPTASG